MRASQEVSIDAPAAALWELIGEPSLYPRFLRDVTRWEKIAGDEGSRPRYHIEVRVGGVELGAVVEITHASAPHELGWESVSGIEHHGHWRVRSDGDRRCTVALDLSYRAPGEVLGMIADGAALPLLHQGLRESLARLKAEVEGSAPARGVVARIAGDTREAVYDAGCSHAAVSEDELKQLVRTRLAPFKVPREIEFVTELPRTATGKVAKAELGEPRR